MILNSAALQIYREREHIAGHAREYSNCCMCNIMPYCNDQE